MIFYENSKSKTFIAGLELPIEKKLFIFQLHDRMPQSETILERRGLKNHVLRVGTCKPSYLYYIIFITEIHRLHLFRTLNPTPPRISSRFQIPDRIKLRGSLLLPAELQAEVQAEKYCQYRLSPKIVTYPYPKAWILRG